MPVCLVGIKYNYQNSNLMKFYIKGRCDIGKAAYAFIAIKRDKVEYQEAEQVQCGSAQQAELIAATAAISNLAEGETATIVSNNKYVIGVLSGSMYASANLDLIKAYKDMVRDNNLTVWWKWMPKDTGNKWSGYVSDICGKALNRK